MPPADGNPGGGGELAVELVAEGLSSPLYLTAPAGDPRLFIVEKPGRIRIVRDGALLPEPFLDLTGQVRSQGFEQGLLSLAFHPNYAANGLFYVDYTDQGGDIRVERFAVSGDPDRADASSALTILQVPEPFPNHNGGLVAFGSDGMLYVGLGDGGSGGDPLGNGQNPGSLLGAILRLDVDGAAPFSIPPDNPFVGVAGARGEIWAWGLRNPWRFAFDRPAGMLYIADVGQDSFEEVNAVAAGAGGLNYGWNRMEGAHCFPAAGCDPSGLTLPVLEYDHSQGCSVTGGFVYRGSRLPFVNGHYFYSDFCRGWLRSFRLQGGTLADPKQWNVGNLGSVLSFGEDASGELYVLSGDGRVQRLVRAP